MNTALNYQPEVLVDTADLSREEWLDYRRLGIGGRIRLENTQIDLK